MEQALLTISLQNAKFVLAVWYPMLRENNEGKDSKLPWQIHTEMIASNYDMADLSSADR